MSMVQVRKAMDTLVAGAALSRLDLSPLITLADGPIRPLLQAQTMRAGQTIPSIAETQAIAELHYWNEQALATANGTTAGYAQGGKPGGDVTPPTRKANQVARFGKTASVTDTMAAVWTRGGSFTLADGELERLYTEALDYDTELKTTEVLNEIEWSLVQGVSANSTAYSVPASPSQASVSTIVSQFDGILQFLLADTQNATSGWSTQTGHFVGAANATQGGGVLLNARAAVYGNSGVLSEQMIRDLAKNMAKLNTPYKPDLMLVNADTTEVINSFHPNQITLANENLVGGASVDTYNTGFSTVKVAYEPQLPPGVILLLNTSLIKRANLIPLGAEPLARVQTQVERMITCEMTMEIRVQKAHGVIFNLAA